MKDEWVLSTVEGYKIDSCLTPVQLRTLAPPIFNQEQFSLVRNKVQKLLVKQAISYVMDSRRGFYSSLFLMSKKDGGQRPVINLKALNIFVRDAGIMQT